MNLRKKFDHYLKKTVKRVQKSNYRPIAILSKNRYIHILKVLLENIKVFVKGLTHNLSVSLWLKKWKLLEKINRLMQLLWHTLQSLIHTYENVSWELTNIYNFFNWDSFHARLNSHYEAWRKISTKRLKHTAILFRKNLQLRGVCQF